MGADPEAYGELQSGIENLSVQQGEKEPTSSPENETELEDIDIGGHRAEDTPIRR
jgi:hypothetical protein